MVQTASSLTAADEAQRREQTWVYFNGTTCRYADAKVGLMTHGLHYGTGCFEGIRAYWNGEKEQLFVLLMAEHYDRMRQSAGVLRMSLDLSTEELCNITLDLIKRNGFRENIYIRPLLYKSAEIIGVRLHDLPDGFAIYMTPMAEYVDTNGISCMVSSWRRIDDTMAPVRAKCTGVYINSALAKSEAVENGFDEAIMLSTDGHVCEGSAENLFIVRNNTLLTPPVTDNILEGITRKVVIRLAEEDLKLPVIERTIDKTELYIADEVFLCGTGAQLSPVVSIDHRTIGSGKPGPVSKVLQDIYGTIVYGKDSRSSEFVTPVY
ncbi:MAG: branched-chain amino acid transaminase [Candidatus Dormibacteria bacterium]